MRSDIVPGAVFPDYELPDHTTKRRKLSELQGEDPLVLVLSRGGFCPKERRQHEGLVALHRELEVGYCRLVTISTDNITETNEYRGGLGGRPQGAFLPVRQNVRPDSRRTGLGAEPAQVFRKEILGQVRAPRRQRRRRARPFLA